MKYELYKLNENTLTIPVPNSYKDCVSLIKSDLFRLDGKMKSTFSVLLKLIQPFYPTLLIWFRLSQYNGWLFPLCRFIYKIKRLKSKVDLPVSVKVGYGFYIGHGMCMVIHDNTIIGNNVNLSQFINIGSNEGTPAMVGDNVYIGPHVCLVENVIIGNNSTIGAGAVVTKDVPDNSTVVGVPAKVINYDNPGRYINNVFKCIYRNEKTPTS